MITLLIVLIGIVSALLILAILIQNPKGGGIDSTFGGQGANQLFGVARSTDFIEKLTWGLIATLFVLCIITAMFVSGGDTTAVPPAQ